MQHTSRIATTSLRNLLTENLVKGILRNLIDSHKLDCSFLVSFDERLIEVVLLTKVEQLELQKLLDNLPTELNEFNLTIIYSGETLVKDSKLV